MAAAFADKIEDGLQCNIHLGILKDTKILPCHHTFCERCLDDWIAQKKGVLICPLCSTNHGPFPNGAKTLPTNYQLERVLEVMNTESEKHVCARQNHKVFAFCSTCLECVCQACLKKHQSHSTQNLDTISQELSHKQKISKNSLQRAQEAYGQLKQNEHMEKEMLAVFRAQCIDAVNAFCDKAVEEITIAVDKKSSILKKQMAEFEELHNEYKEGETIINTISKESVDPPEDVQKMWDQLMTIKSLSNTSIGVENPFLRYEIENPFNIENISAGKLMLGTSADVSLSKIVVNRDAESVDASVYISVNLQDSQKQEVSYGKEDIVLRVIQPDLSKGNIQNTDGLYVFVPTMIGDHKIHAYIYGRELYNSPYDLRVSPTFNQKSEKFGNVKYKAAHDVIEYKDEIYVTDKGNNRIVVIGKDGVLRREFTFRLRDMVHDFDPFGITISQKGVVHMTDMRNHEVFLSDTNGNLLKRFGKSRLKKPNGIALKDNGDILVVDYGNHRICVFDQTGVFKRYYGGQGKDFGQFFHPWFIDMQSNNSWVVTDCKNFRFQIILPNGNARPVPVTVYDKGALVRGVTVDPNDNIIVSVQAKTYGRYYHVLMYNSDGVFRGCISKENVLLRPRGMCVTKIATDEQVLLVADETGVLQFRLI
ncbi:tripartite motif-containing protein 2-like [Anneissia japonica]|uniref:tripartite motif-containing protein 2-like n=1 Tax=Anneissia japonica TaxID=1529436 RepID=UPI0014258637|nr:tripartite motif-containing protein 2-like [Anneissia japonica]